MVDIHSTLGKLAAFAPLLKKTTPTEVKREMVHAALSFLLPNVDPAAAARIQARINSADAKNLYALFQDPSFVADLQSMTQQPQQITGPPSAVICCVHCGQLFPIELPY